MPDAQRIERYLQCRRQRGVGAGGKHLCGTLQIAQRVVTGAQHPQRNQAVTRPAFGLERIVTTLELLPCLYPVPPRPGAQSAQERRIGMWFSPLGGQLLQPAFQSVRAANGQ